MLKLHIQSLYMDSQDRKSKLETSIQLSWQRLVDLLDEGSTSEVDFDQSLAAIINSFHALSERDKDTIHRQFRGTRRYSCIVSQKDMLSRPRFLNPIEIEQILWGCDEEFHSSLPEIRASLQRLPVIIKYSLLCTAPTDKAALLLEPEA